MLIICEWITKLPVTLENMFLDEIGDNTCHNTIQIVHNQLLVTLLT